MNSRISGQDGEIVNTFCHAEIYDQESLALSGQQPGSKKPEFRVQNRYEAGGIPNIRETQDCVKKIMARYGGQ